MGVDRPAEASLALVTRRDCHLCDEMKRVLDAEGARYTTIDVDADPALRARWGDIVPVLLRDGKAVAKVRLAPRQLERILRRRR